MIHGVGVDIVEIDRIRNSVEHFGDAFIERVFTDDEIAYCNKKRDPHPSFAARFAAKEAIIKALISEDVIGMKEIEVYINEHDKPSIKPSARLREIMDASCITGIHLSLSHERTFAVAYAVLETS